VQLSVYGVVVFTPVNVCVPLAAFVPVHPPLAMHETVAPAGNPDVLHVTVTLRGATPDVGEDVTVTVWLNATGAQHSASTMEKNRLKQGFMVGALRAILQNTVSASGRRSNAKGPGPVLQMAQLQRFAVGFVCEVE
jgi:hypothetical protein